MSARQSLGRKLLILDPEDRYILDEYYISACLHRYDMVWATDKKTHKRQEIGRLVLNAAPNEIIDHINGDRFDNRRCNLRRCSAAQNSFNRRLRRDSGNKYKGLGRIGAKWQAQICHKGKQYYLGLFATQEEAARAYDAKARELYGAFAALNFPETGETDALATGKRCRRTA